MKTQHLRRFSLRRSRSRARVRGRRAGSPDAAASTAASRCARPARKARASRSATVDSVVEPLHAARRRGHRQPHARVRRLSLGQRCRGRGRRVAPSTAIRCSRRVPGRAAASACRSMPDDDRRAKRGTSTSTRAGSSCTACRCTAAWATRKRRRSRAYAPGFTGDVSAQPRRRQLRRRPALRHDSRARPAPRVRALHPLAGELATGVAARERPGPARPAVPLLTVRATMRAPAFPWDAGAFHWQTTILRSRSTPRFRDADCPPPAAPSPSTSSISRACATPSAAAANRSRCRRVDASPTCSPRCARAASRGRASSRPAARCASR